MAKNDGEWDIGTRQDGTLKVYEPGEPIPPVRIVTPDGEELTPEQAEAHGGEGKKA